MNRPLSLLICILIPVMVLLVGIIFSGFYAFQTMPGVFRDDVRAVVPPKFSALLPQPQRYSLWAYSRVNFEGTEYQSGEELPAGTKIHVIDTISGDFLPLNNWMTASKNLLDESAFLIGTFETVVADQEVEIIASGLKDKTVIGVSSRGIGDMFHAVIMILGIFLLSLFLATTILVVLLHRRQKQMLAAAAAS